MFFPLLRWCNLAWHAWLPPVRLNSNLVPAIAMNHGLIAMRTIQAQSSWLHASFVAVLLRTLMQAMIQHLLRRQCEDISLPPSFSFSLSIWSITFWLETGLETVLLPQSNTLRAEGFEIASVWAGQTFKFLDEKKVPPQFVDMKTRRCGVIHQNAPNDPSLKRNICMPSPPSSTNSARIKSGRVSITKLICFVPISKCNAGLTAANKFCTHFLMCQKTGNEQNVTDDVAVALCGCICWMDDV